MATVDEIKDEDERLLAEMGYKQELKRGWSAFSNFAISFTIISVLAGCFTTYGQAWNFGGPVAISWGWPLISIPILIIGFSMSEIVAAPIEVVLRKFSCVIMQPFGGPVVPEV